MATTIPRVIIVRRGTQGLRGLTGLAAPETVTVAQNIESVIAIAEDLDNIDTVVDNLPEILDAPNQAAAAEASALAAAAAAQSSLWRDVVFLTFANSPYTITSTDNGKLFSVDSSGGAVAITLPTISPLTMPFNVGVKKTSSDINNTTISRSGSDLIDGQTTKVISTPNAGVTFIADKDPTPDAWTTAEFGATAGNMKEDFFTGNGTTGPFILSQAPGSAENCWIDFDGGAQQTPGFTVVGTSLTFTENTTTGVSIRVKYGTTLSIGVAADGSVTTNKLGNLSVTLEKLASAVAAALVPVASVLPYAGSAAPTGYLLCDGSAVSRTTYADLFAAIGIAHGQGNGSTTFNVPDYRGYLLRGVDGSANRDPDKATRTAMNTGGNTGNNVGSVQLDALQGHMHDVQAYSTNQGAAGAQTSTATLGTSGPLGTQYPAVKATNLITNGTNGTPRVASETRPMNAYANFIIKI